MKLEFKLKFYEIKIGDQENNTRIEIEYDNYITKT